MITESIVLDADTVIFKKGENRLALTKYINYIVAVNLDIRVMANQPFIPLAKVYAEAVDATYDYKRIVGKMVLKSENSKYFGAPKLREHLNNGNITFEDYTAVLHIAEMTLDKYKEYKDNKC